MTKIRNRMLCLVGLLATLSSQLGLAVPLTHEQKVSDLDQLVASMKAGYGPLQYKATALGLDIDQLRDQYVAKIKKTKTNGDFYYLIRQFVAEFKDSHFSATIPSNHISLLPLITDLVDGKLVIEAVSRSMLPKFVFPFDRGDEVVAMDGVPADEVLDELQRYMGMGFSLTARRSAAASVAFRAGRIMPVPTGLVDVTLRSRETGEEKTVKLPWLEFGSPLDEETSSPSLGQLGGFKLKAQANYYQLSVNDVWGELFAGQQAEDSFRCSGSTRISIPEGATVIMTTPFVAYYHPTPKGNIGYLRIPHYSPTNAQTGQPEYELRFAQYEYAVSVLEKETVGLVIDQDHNCGGSVSYLNDILGLFMNAPYKPMQFRLLANKAEYLDFRSWMNAVPATTLAHHDLESVVSKIESAWEKGEFMTEMTSIDGTEWMEPNSIRYTKPIVMTIDEMSGSGGDAFPALMKGYGRAKLVGTRTMGAGGHVVRQPPLYYSQISVRMTKSLFYRPDGAEVENNGATPDYPYTITVEDYVDGFKGYQAFYLEKLMGLLN